MKKTFPYYFVLFCAVSAIVHSQNLVLESVNIDFKSTEGPVWDGQEFIYFTDIPAEKIIKFSVLDKTFSTVLENSGRANGLMFDADMNLIVCESGSGKIQKRDINGNFISTIASEYNNIRLNTTNDLCVDKKGGVYFTDPVFGSGIQHQLTNRVYYVTPSGTVIALIDDMDKPNGVLLSNDGTVLYVNDSRSNIVRAYDVKSDGTIFNQRSFAILEMEPGELIRSGADGMTTDTDGNLYVTSRVGVQIYDKTGKALQVITIPEKSTNCIFGGVNKNVLYITANKNLYSIELPVTGIRHPFDLPKVAILSVSEFDTKSPSVQLYPNPVRDNFAIIDAKGFNINNIEIELYDMIGKKISNLNFSINEGLIKIEFNNSLTSGNYLIQIKDGIHKKVAKIILEY